MRREEAIYHGLTDLEPRLGTIKLEYDTQPRYKCVKLGVRRVIWCEMSEIEVATNYSERVLKFIQELDREKAKKKRE